MQCNTKYMSGFNTCFQYFQYFCNTFQYFQQIFCTFFVLYEYREKKDQNWTKNELGFLLYELLHQYICGSIFLLLKYFLDNLFLTAFVQNVISKFVIALPQKLNNSLLEKSWACFCAAACQNCVCAKFKVDHFTSLNVHHT